MKANYTECRETSPHDLEPGNKVAVPWGFSVIESVELDDNSYTITLIPDVYGKRETIKSAIGNWPFVATGNMAPKGKNRILRDGTRF